MTSDVTLTLNLNEPSGGVMPVDLTDAEVLLSMKQDRRVIFREARADVVDDEQGRIVVSIDSDQSKKLKEGVLLAECEARWKDGRVYIWPPFRLGMRERDIR